MTMWARLIPVCLLSSIIAAAGTLSGHVSHGQTFARPISHELWFCLFPEPDVNGGGWRISVQTSCLAAGNNFASVATPPFHGVNAIEIEGWHFDAGANAPQRIREFQFVLNQKNWQTLIKALNSNYDPAKALSDVRVSGLGHAILTTTRMARGRSADGTSIFQWMDFRLKFEIPQRH